MTFAVLFDFRLQNLHGLDYRPGLLGDSLRNLGTRRGPDHAG